MTNRTEAKLTETECEKLAEDVFDKVIGPSIPRQWDDPLSERRINRFFDSGMLPPPLLLVNGNLVYPPEEIIDSRRRAWDREYVESLDRLDRKEIVPLLKTYFLRENYSKNHAEELFNGFASNLWWRITEEIEKHVFTIKRGRKAKAQLTDYNKIGALADELIPVCEKLLSQLEEKTKHSVKEILEFLKTDHQKPCTFLLSHLQQLESALANNKFLERRKTLNGRARLLAYGMAGADFGLKLSTSAALAEQAKRTSE